MSIKLIDYDFQTVSEEFYETLNKAIIHRVLCNYGIIGFQGKPVSRRKLIIEFANEKIEFNPPKNNHQYNFDQYKIVVMPIILEFKRKLKHLLKYGDLKHYTTLKSSTSAEVINCEKIFNTIDYNLREKQKTSTPVLYTGMTN